MKFKGFPYEGVFSQRAVHCIYFINNLYIYEATRAAITGFQKKGLWTVRDSSGQEMPIFACFGTEKLF